MPVWANEYVSREYAKINETLVYAYPLADFLLQGFPYLLRENIGIAAFPLPAGNYAVTDAKKFAANLYEQRDQYYGEAFPLPYL